MMINHGKREITIPNNFIVRKDILKNVKVRESNGHADFILSYIWSDLEVTYKELKMLTCAECCSLLFVANLPLMQLGFCHTYPIK